MTHAANKTKKLYGGRRPSELPAYSIGDAARSLDLAPSTVRSWVLGRTYSTSSGLRRSTPPLIHIADKRTKALSFINLVEIHVLAAIRRGHSVKLPEIRKAVTYLESNFDERHPLATFKMKTDGTSLFVEKYGGLINASQKGQMAMKAVLELYLRRIECDDVGVPIRLFPFTTSRREEDEERSVTIDPALQFGRPCIAGTGIPTIEVAERYKAGELIRELSEDFGCTGEQIEAAIRYEFRPAA